MGQQYVDLQKAQMLGTELIGPDGKIIAPSGLNFFMNQDRDSKKPKLAFCSEKNKDSVEKKVNKAKENILCSVEEWNRFICPRCTKAFSSLSNTYRHLINGKTIQYFPWDTLCVYILTYKCLKVPRLYLIFCNIL